MLAPAARARTKQGAPFYQAPEIAKVKEDDPSTHYTEAVDMYSFGVVMLELALVYLAPLDEGPSLTLSAFRALSSIDAYVADGVARLRRESADIAAVVRACLQKDPRHRITSTSALALLRPLHETVHANLQAEQAGAVDAATAERDRALSRAEALRIRCTVAERELADARVALAAAQQALADTERAQASADRALELVVTRPPPPCSPARCRAVGDVPCGEGVGVAVSAVLGLIVTTSLESHSMSIFEANAPFALLEVVGHEGDGPLEFRSPGRLCFTARGAATVLVTDTGNNRVQEVNVVSRRHVATWGAGLLHSPRGVAASTTMVAVSEEGSGLPPRVTLFDAACRTLMCCCAAGAGVLVVPRGLCFDHGGAAIVVADACTSRLTIFHASDGSLARYVDLGARTPVDVAVCEGGFLVADSESTVVLVDGATGACTQELDVVEGDLGSPQPTALGLVWGVGLVVRSRDGGRVTVLETGT